jgi:endonuclease/exonuclease/phosphatase family metal-dependent hydrolase
MPLKNSNLTAIELRGNFGRILIFNVYNSWRHMRTLEVLEKHIDDIIMAGNAPDMIWMGDFNFHDPMWDDTSNHHLFTGPNLQRSVTLINLLAKHDMRMALAGGIATLDASNPKNCIRPDNVLCSTDLLNTFIYCDVEEELQPVSADHFPIISTLDLTPIHTDPKPCRNYRATDWEEFREALEQHPDTLPPSTEITSVE